MHRLRRSGRRVFALGLWLLPALATAVELPPEHHPSLLFSAAEVPRLKDRVQRLPYSSWWGTILSRIGQPSTGLDERAKIRRAKSLAFAYALTDSVPWAEAAAQLLEQVRFPPRGGDLGEPHIEGEAVALYAEAYDMIHPYLAGDSRRLQGIRDILAEEAQYLYEGIEVDLGFFFD